MSTEDISKESKFQPTSEEMQKELENLKRQLSTKEQEAYDYIKNAKQPLAIRDMPPSYQGAIGKLTKYKLVEVYRERTPVSKHGFSNMLTTTCVRIIKAEK